MKKIFYVMTMAAVGLIMMSCSQLNNQITDTTKLWPAYDPATEKFGYIDANGKMVIPGQFDKVTTFSCGYAAVELGGKEYFIDKKGNLQTTPSFDYADPFCNNYSLVGLDGMAGLMSTKFDFTVQPMFDELREVNEGLAAYQITPSSQWGYIDPKGKVVIKPTYEYAYDFIDGLAVVLMGSNYGAINKKGEIVIAPIYNASTQDLWSAGNNRLVFIDKEGKFGLIDTKGNIIVQPVYDFIIPSMDQENLFGTWDDDSQTCGVIDGDGNVKFTLPKDQTLWEFCEGYAPVVTISSEHPDGIVSFVDKNGSTIFTLEVGYQPVEPGFHNGLVLVYKTELDEESNLIATFKYLDVKGNIIYQWTMKGGGGFLSAPKRAAIPADHKLPSKNFSLSLSK